MIIWPALQFSVSSCTTTSRPVFRTDSSIISRSQGTIERRSISSMLTESPSLAMASIDFSTVLPHATMVTSLPSVKRRAAPIGTAEMACVTSRSAQSMCLGTSTSVGSSPCIADQRRPTASSGVLGMTTLSPGKWAMDASLAWECQSEPPGR